MKPQAPDAAVAPRSSRKKPNGTTAPPVTSGAQPFSHILDLPRELRDLIWEHSLLAVHAPPAIASPASIASAYRQYDSWGEEANHYPRRTRVNSTALLCCSRQVHVEVNDAIARLRAQRRLACQLRILLRNEKHLFLDWTSVPAVSPHYDDVFVEFKMVGAPERKGLAGSGGGMKTLHPNAFASGSAHRTSTPPFTRTPWTSILYDRTNGDFEFHRHLFKMLARLRSYGPSFVGDPVIFSAISSSTTSSCPSSSSSSFSSSSSSSSSSSAPRTPTSATHLTFNVLSPPPQHSPPDAFRPPLWPWTPPRHVAAAARRTHGLVRPLCVALLLREFVVWALHGRDARRGENAFLKTGFPAGIAVLLDGADVRPQDVGPGAPDAAGGARWWAPVWRDEVEARACEGGAGLHRYCAETRELRWVHAGAGRADGGEGGVEGAGWQVWNVDAWALPGQGP
ncbi:uncharacterized protein LTHEOB_10298 [Neofusicoccum parvum]|nr:uncharacterized protein LTHEOB_10298 [Neofusicoccum parvum]